MSPTISSRLDADPGLRRWDLREFQALDDLGLLGDTPAELVDGVVLVRTPDGGTLPRLWTRDEYHAMGEMGLFLGQRVQLVDGEVVVLSPQSSRHYLALETVSEALKQAFGRRFWVRTQAPLALGLRVEPEPDVAVVEGVPADFLDEHPGSAALVVEVSLSTLAYDRCEKGSLYARAGVPEFWVVNLVDRQLELYREPIEDASQPFGFRYESLTVATAGQTVMPSAAVGAEIEVAGLLT